MYSLATGDVTHHVVDALDDFVDAHREDHVLVDDGPLGRRRDADEVLVVRVASRHDALDQSLAGVVRVVVRLQSTSNRRVKTIRKNPTLTVTLTH